MKFYPNAVTNLEPNPYILICTLCTVCDSLTVSLVIDIFRYVEQRRAQLNLKPSVRVAASERAEARLTGCLDLRPAWALALPLAGAWAASMPGRRP